MSSITHKPWGFFDVYFESDTYWVKKLVIIPKASLSLQSHEKREEFWCCVHGEGQAQLIDFPKTLKHGNITYMIPGTTVKVPARTKHRLTNTGSDPLVVIEVAVGFPTESDIVRYEDNYGRVCEEQDPERG